MGTVISKSPSYMVLKGSIYYRSHKPEIRKFKKWIIHEVLPSLRKTGSYSTDRQYKIPKSFSEALYLAAEQTEELEKANAELEVARPKAALVDAHYGVALSSITKFVRTLKGVNINRVKQKLRELKYLYRLNGDYGQYRVYSRYRDKLFVEKYDPMYDKYDIYLTREGELLLTDMYKRGRVKA